MWLRFHREIWRTRMQIVLIRHCVNDAVERVLCGRTLDVSSIESAGAKRKLFVPLLQKAKPSLRSAPRGERNKTAIYFAQVAAAYRASSPPWQKFYLAKWRG